MKEAKLSKIFALGITVCRWYMPGGRRFVTVVDDFGRLVEINEAQMQISAA